MPSFNESGKKTYIAHENIEEGRRVQLRQDGSVEYASANVPGIGFALDNTDEGEQVAVRLMNCPGTFFAIASGPFVIGESVYADEEGKVSSLPFDKAGAYIKIGRAEEEALEDGDMVEIFPEQVGEIEIIRAYVVSEPMEAGRRFELRNDERIQYVDDDSAGIGVTLSSVAADEVALCRLFGDEPVLEMAATSEVVTGGKVYAATDGMVQALPAATGTYFQIGVAMDDAEVDGDLINVQPIVGPREEIA